MRIVDGSLSKVAWIGSVRLSPEIILKSVLHVPKLDCNLMSISKFTRDHHCVTKFLPNVCFSGIEFEEEDWQC